MTRCLKNRNTKTSYSVTKEARKYLNEFQKQQVPELNGLGTSTEKVKHMETSVTNDALNTLTDKMVR